jgi:hypothetical protein
MRLVRNLSNIDDAVVVGSHPTKVARSKIMIANYRFVGSAESPTYRRLKYLASPLTFSTKMLRKASLLSAILMFIAGARVQCPDNALGQFVLFM